MFALFDRLKRKRVEGIGFERAALDRPRNSGRDQAPVIARIPSRTSLRAASMKGGICRRVRIEHEKTDGLARPGL
jgi:hypothetical protein